MPNEITRFFGFSGVTLLDLLLMISGGWAIPFGVLAGLGNHSPWRFLAFLVGGIGGLFWGWYCKLFGSFIARKFLETKGKPIIAAALPLSASLTIFIGVLGLSLLSQYAIYRFIRFALETARL